MQKRNRLNQPLFQRLKSSKFVRFLGVGVINTLFGYAVFALFLSLGLEYPIATLLATICGVLFNFKTIGGLVFANRNNKLLARFICVYAVIYLLNVGGLRVAKQLQINLYLAAALLVLPLAMVSFTLNKLFVFRS